MQNREWNAMQQMTLVFGFGVGVGRKDTSDSIILAMTLDKVMALSTIHYLVYPLVQWYLITKIF